MLSDPAPRPPRCYDPATPPHRDEQGVHVYDHATIRGLLRDPQRVTSDVSELITAEQRDDLHPVSSFVWATDRRTLSGRPGRHAALRSAMAPWFAVENATRLTAAAEAIASEAADECTSGGSFDAYHDYALPIAVTYFADWLGITPTDVMYAVDDQLAVRDVFADWPPLATAEMDEYYRAVMTRPGLSGVAAQAREMVADGVLTERESWGVLYGISVGAVATATTATLTVGLSLEHDVWPTMTGAALARPAVEEALRLGTPFPQATRIAREPFTVGDVAVQPGEQVLMWLTAANRDLPGVPHTPLDRFDPARDTSAHLGWGSGYHRCGGLHHARTAAVAAVTTLARRCPDLAMAGAWKRYAGVDDGYVAAPVITLADRPPPAPG
jgi:oxidation protein CepF/oxidation protein CepG